MPKVALLLAIAGVAISWCANAQSADSSAEDALVLGAVAATFCSGSEPAYVVLNSRTVSPEDYAPDWFKAIDVEKDVPQAMKARNVPGTIVPASANYGCLRLTDTSAITRAFHSRPKHFSKRSGDSREWTAFHEVFPGSSGVASLSLPAYSSARNEAIVYLEMGCGSLCGGGTIYFLTRQNGVWSVIKQSNIWIS